MISPTLEETKTITKNPTVVVVVVMADSISPGDSNQSVASPPHQVSRDKWVKSNNNGRRAI